MNRENRIEKPRGYAEDDVWYHSRPESLRQGERDVEAAASLLEGALADVDVLRSVLLGLQSLVHCVRVDSAVLDDVSQLCHACAAASAGSSSTHDYLSGRARAAARQARRVKSQGS